MTMKTRILRISWEPSPWDQKIEQLCANWANVPYRENGKTRSGIDCVHFGASIMDELQGTSHAKFLQSLPPDACVHNRAGVERCVRALLKACPSRRLGRGEPVQAGDWLVTGPAGAEAGHLFVVGGRPAVLWHASPPRVAFTGYGIPETDSLVAVFRALERNWV